MARGGLTRRLIFAPLAGVQGDPRGKDDELSVYIASEKPVDDLLKGHEGFGVVHFTAGQVREACEGVKLCRCDDEIGHVLVCGRISGGAAKRLQRKADWVPGKWPSRDATYKPPGPADTPPT